MMTIEAKNISALPFTDGLIGLDQQIIARASELVPFLASNAERADRERRVPQENIDAITQAGLWSLTRPRSRGGLQTNVRTAVEVISKLAEGCGSTSWCVMLSTIEQLVMSYLNERAQEDIYALSADPRFCGPFAPTSQARRVDGGVILSGRWGWCSNSEHSNWAFMGLAIPDENGNTRSFGQALIPMSECRIDPTWDSAGLKASASHHLVCNEVFVPDHRVFDVVAAGNGDRKSAYPGTLYKTAFSATLSLMNAAPMVGLGRSALRDTLTLIGEKPVTYTTYAQGKNAPTSQIDVAVADTKINTAYLYMANTADMLDQASVDGRELADLEKARARMAVGVMGKEARDGVDHLLDANGASVFQLTNPVQRAWRDLAVASRHGYLINTTCAQMYGAALLNGQQIATML